MGCAVWERYSYPEMRELWSLESKFKAWMEVELAICDAWAELGVIPKDASQKIRERASFTVERVIELEREFEHDLLAFVKAMTENMGEEGRYVHMGVTSYDVEDTALGLLLKRSCEILERDLDEAMDAVKQRAVEHKHTIMMGRTHGIHAEPITFGLKLLVWLSELERHRERLLSVKERVAAGKISGVVGTYATVDPQVEEIVLRNLGLNKPKVSTQILQRDRHAEYLCLLALIASSIEQFATEIRNLQRTEIAEVEEPFRKGQRGSSAMPHKRNPIRSERLCGLVRLIRSMVIPALENVPTWHERDLTNSSVERVILPEASILTDYILRQFAAIVRGLVVKTENMRRNLEKTQGTVFSQRVMLALVKKGWSRDDAYKLVQQCAFEAIQQERPFRSILESRPEIRGALRPTELDELFDYGYFIRHVDEIFRRFGL